MAKQTGGCVKKTSLVAEETVGSWILSETIKLIMSVITPELDAIKFIQESHSIANDCFDCQTIITFKWHFRKDIY